MKSDDNSKIKRLFSFLREIHNLKTPPVASIQDYDWLQVISELPKHEALKGAFAQTDSTSELSKQYNVILEIDRPKETPCPEPPEAIRGWLSAGWKNPAKEVSFLDLRDVTKGSRVVRTEKFADSADRKKLKTSWLRKRSRWAEKEAPIREAIAVFNHFFELHSLIKKEADKYQLLLADGCLTWNSEREPLDHPILSQKVALKFDPEVPRFSVVLDPDSELKIASHILRYHGLNGQIINETKESIEAQALDLTETKKIKELLKSFVHTAFQDGVFVENAKTKFDPENPHIKPLPCLLLAKKSQSVAEVFDKLLTHLPEDSAQPAVLQRIVGLDPKDENPTAAGDFEFFQTKPANEEQFRIVQTLENTGNVLVQGPPGTGKSHTIANLIGHLLAKGKRILVTSHTSKALKVVREKVAEPLQPLCVANLSNDAESKAQLKDSITGIVNYLSKTDTKKLEKTTAELQAKRKQIKQQLEDLESQILHVLQTEYTEINIPGEESMSPIQAAKFLDQHRESENWIPGAVDKQARLPLTEKEIADLYESNLQMDQTQEACLLDETLDLTGLPKAREFEKLSELKKKVASQTDDQMLGFFEADVEIDEQVLEDFTSELEANLQSIVGDDWTRTIFEELVIDRNRTGPWLELIEIVENTYQEITRNENLIISLDPAINFDWTEELYQASLKLSDRLYAKGKIGLVAKLINPKWRFILNNSTVDGHRPNTGDEVRAISYLYKNEIDREKLIRRWNRQMGPTGAPEAADTKPELSARPHLKKLEAVVHWHTDTWDYALDVFDQIGFRVEDAMDDREIDSRASSESLINFLLETVVPSLKSKLNSIKLARINNQIETVLEQLDTSALSKASLDHYAKDLKKALQKFDSDLYQQSYERLSQLTHLRNTHTTRTKALKTLDEVAPEWSIAIRLRVAPHDNSQVPGRPALAWKYNQIAQELDERQSINYSDLQRQLELTKKQYVEVNSEYVECLSWGYQLTRTGLAEKQALVGWQQLQDKMTKSGRGKLDAQRRKEAQAQLKTCKNSVPVWIMPLSKVYESFDFSSPEFDVLILDEASQSDITAIVALGIAKQVVIVGDKEQVTPQGIGQDLEQIQGLITEYLDGVPNKMAYDGKTSIYDIAEQSFGDSIRLVEHFRCVPDIINYSNHLSYNGEIKPLREASAGQFSQPLVEHQVSGTREGTKKTNREEAVEIAALITAMTLNPEYQDVSIGVISLLGSQQANLIDSILRQRLTPKVYEKHNILCGDSANFQGDERDVMFLSMVDSCEEPPLRIMQQEAFKKRYNVAVSRARDQIWIVHSLKPETDLKVGDLRLDLLTHFRNPQGQIEEVETSELKTESDFQQRLLKDLSNRGYQVELQRQVGTYTIDMVVSSDEKRVAIECEGEKYQTEESVVENLNMQGALERLGWNFIRIRGSEYFRSPVESLNIMVAEFERLGVRPVSEEKADGKGASDELISNLKREAATLRAQWTIDGIRTELQAKPSGNIEELKEDETDSQQAMNH